MCLHSTLLKRQVSVVSVQSSARSKLLVATKQKLDFWFVEMNLDVLFALALSQ